MSSHDELIGEMPLLEKMTIQDRLKHAKKRRNQQLKRYQQNERDFQRRTKKLNSQKSDSSVQGKDGNNRIMFAANVQLLEAAARGDTQEVEAFLKNGVDPNTGNEDGLTALHQSCIDNREDMLKVLLDNGADVNIQDREMWTPLHAASTCGHRDLTAQLITRGANLLAINSDGNMPYDICEDEETLDYIESQMAAQGITQDQIDDLREVAPNKMLEDMKKLSKDEGNLEFRDSVGATPLHIAVAQGFEKVVEFLIEAKVDIHAQDEDGWQPIHAAACWAQAEIIHILVEHGADLESKTNNKETPLMICEEDDIKSLIHQLKTENLKNQRHNLMRRGSSRKNRGSSIRRSSKKGEMRKMDAKGEAAFIQSQEIPATNIDDVITNGSTEEGQSESLSNGQASSPDSGQSPVADVIMIDEPLPKSGLSHLDTQEDDGKDKGEESAPSAESKADGNQDVIIQTNQVEPKRPKSILKKTPSRVETEPETPKKVKKDERRSEKKVELDRNLSQEQKLKEKEEKEKERQRLKEEKEKKRQREKEEKQRRKEDQASRKQRGREDKSKKQVVKDEVSNGKQENQEAKGGSPEVGGEVLVTGESNGPGPDTLSELKRTRQQTNSPIHSNSASPDLSASSGKSSDSQVSEKPKVSNNKQGSRFSARFPFSLPFMQSYDLHDPASNYSHQKRDSVAMTAEMQDIALPADSGNSTNVLTVNTEDGETLKKFTAYPDTQRLNEDETTEACCIIM